MDAFFKIVETEYILMPTWKWFSMVILLILFPIIRRAMGVFVLKIKNSSLFANSKNVYVSEIIKTPLEIPLAWIVTFLVFISVVDMFDFPKNISKYIILLAQVLIGFRWIQLLIMSIDVIAAKWSQSFAGDDDTSTQIIPFAVKTAKVVLVILGVLLTLQNLGINVVSVLAGLGIGGLAIALAGQETVANLFGSITILIDKPFKLQDHVKVLEVEGIVTEIGFRSTRIKTFTNSVVNIPNSTLAKEKLENLSVRQNRRIRHTINLAYETQLPLIKVFIESVSTYLSSRADVDGDSITTSLTALSSYSVDVQVTFYVLGNESATELKAQQEFLLFVLELAQKMKIELAYPTQKSLVAALNSGPANKSDL